MTQPHPRKATLTEALKNRVLVLDGAMGTMLRQLQLTDEQMCGHLIAPCSASLKNNPDILNLTHPGAVAAVHHRYLSAGADIIATNTFNAIQTEQRDYATEHLVHRINLEGARLARAEADRFEALNPDKPRFVAGTMGPGSVALSETGRRNGPTRRAITFNDMSHSYKQQALALIQGGVDLLLIETIYNLQNARAAIAGAQMASKQCGIEMPLILSATLTSRGRIYSGENPEELFSALACARPLAFGLNCSAGAESLIPHVLKLADVAAQPVIFFPSAGLPDSAGNYPASVSEFAQSTASVLHNKHIRIVGGCCGTTPAHIAALSRIINAH